MSTAPNDNYDINENLSNIIFLMPISSQSNFNKYLTYSVIIHIALITLFSIKWYYNTKTSYKTIDITLVSERTTVKPDNPDFMAQANNLGSGNSDTKHEPSNDKNSKLPLKPENILNNEKTNQQEQVNNQNFLPSHINNNTNSIKSINKADNKTNDRNIITHENQNINLPENINFYVETKIQKSYNSLLEKIKHRSELLAKRPKKRFISASSQEYRDAEYINKWRNTIEYYGNKYYPSQVKARELSGDVLLAVAIKADGSIYDVKIAQSSGIKILDEAAMQTVTMAAPFEPFTPEMSKDTDILEIVRTWRFKNNALETR